MTFLPINWPTILHQLLFASLLITAFWSVILYIAHWAKKPAPPTQKIVSRLPKKEAPQKNHLPKIRPRKVYSATTPLVGRTSGEGVGRSIVTK